MRLTKIEKAERLLNDSFPDLLREKFAERFSGLLVETRWSVFSMQLVTTLESRDDFTPEQYQWVAAFSEGYAAALVVIQGVDGATPPLAASQPEVKS